MVISTAVTGLAREFPDVPGSSPYYAAVSKLSDLGVIAGRDNGLFDPDTEVTRAEFCAFLSRANGYSSAYQAKSVPFPDVSANYWARDVISFSYESGFINGMEDGTFRPAAKVTAAEAVKMVVCASGAGDTSLASVGPMWYSGYFERAQEKGFLSGLDLQPAQPITRAMVAQLVYNSLDESKVIVPGSETETPASPAPPPAASAEPDENGTAGEAEQEQAQQPAEPTATPEPGYVPSEALSIFIDAGHNYSGVDTGANGNGLKEQDITFAIAQQLKPILERCGFTVLMSRNYAEENVPGSSTKEVLEQRAAMANEAGAHYFVSIHCNSGGGTGTETYHYPGSSSGEAMAEAIQRHVVEEVGLRDRGVKDADFSVLRNTAMPAVLVETGFIDHAETDSKLLGSAEGQYQFAVGIAKGICEYAGVAYVE